MSFAACSSAPISSLHTVLPSNAKGLENIRPDRASSAGGAETVKFSEVLNDRRWLSRVDEGMDLRDSELNDVPVDRRWMSLF